MTVDTVEAAAVAGRSARTASAGRSARPRSRVAGLVDADLPAAETLK